MECLGLVGIPRHSSALIDFIEHFIEEIIAIALSNPVRRTDGEGMAQLGRARVFLAGGEQVVALSVQSRSAIGILRVVGFPEITHT